jgi:hypothetical protein
MTRAVELAQVAALGVSEAFKNRIINGAMVIDQRNAGAAVTAANGVNTFFTDRFKMYKDSGATITGQQSTTTPTGFVNSLLITATTGSSPTSGQEQLLIHVIEGYNFADVGWGTADPRTITLSFQVRSSLTGTFSGALQASGTTATYVFNYTINAANTWETKTITVAGPTTGTFLTTNGAGLYLIFDIGSGSTYEATPNVWTTGNKYRTSGSVQVAATTGATWYITGVQLEVGSTATSFDYRPYGTELVLCQRYFEIGGNNAPAQCEGTDQIWASIQYKVTKRATPTIALIYPGKLTIRRYGIAETNTTSASFVLAYLGTTSSQVRYSGFAGLSAGSPGFTSGYESLSPTVDPFSISAEL